MVFQVNTAVILIDKRIAGNLRTRCQDRGAQIRIKEGPVAAVINRIALNHAVVTQGGAGVNHGILVPGAVYICTRNHARSDRDIVSAAHNIYHPGIARSGTDQGKVLDDDVVGPIDLDYVVIGGTRCGVEQPGIGGITRI